MDEQSIKLGEAIINIGINLTVEEINDIQDQIAKDLIIAAIEYKNIVQSTQEYLLGVQELLKAFRRYQLELKEEYGDNIKLNAIEKYREKRQQITTMLADDKLKKLYEASFIFQEKLNKALGQTVKTIFVFEGKDGPELREISSKDLIYFDYDKNGNIVARYKNLTQGLQEKFGRLEEDSKFNEENAVKAQGLKNTYQEVVKRFNIARKKCKWNVVLWKITKDWEGYSVSSRGDIKEAYANFVIINDLTPTFVKDMENNVRDYIIEGVAKVDATSGMLEGDISKDGVEYAVKSVGATTLGLSQLKEIADQIISGQGTFGKQKLQKIKESLQRDPQLRNKAINQVQSNIDELVEQLKENGIVIVN